MSEKMEKLLKQQEQIKARIQRERSKQRVQARKLDTRRKVVIGGHFIGALKQGKMSVENFRGLIAMLSEKDQALFPLDWIESRGKGD